MADFIAVIRRAVTGLPNNTPEMRTKVYDKARAAVRRQLETMNPRPSEEMLKRQLDKLEAAIIEVDSEYAEALPAVEDDGVEALAYADEPSEAEAYDPPAAASDAVEPAPSWDAPAEEQRPSEYNAHPYQHEQTIERPESYGEVESDGDRNGSVDERSAGEPEPVAGEIPYSEQDDEPVLTVEPAEPEDTSVVYGWQPQTEIHPEPSEPLEVEAMEPVSAGEADNWPVSEPAAWTESPAESQQAEEPEDLPEEEPVSEEPTPVVAASESSPFDEWERSLEASRAAAVEAAERPSEEPVAPAPYDPYELHPAQVGEDVQEQEQAEVVPQSAEPPRAVEMPTAGLDLLDWEPPATTSSVNKGEPLPVDDFADWLTPAAVTAGTAATSSRMTEALDELELEPTTGKPAASRAATDGDFDELMAATEAKAYKAPPTRKRSLVPLLLGLAGLVVIAGGGYAVWMNKDAMGEFVTGLVSSASNGTGDEAGDVATTEGQTPPTPVDTATGTEAPQAQAPAEGEVAGRKFTQRLLANGTEVDEGDGSVGTGEEGRSVSEQTLAAADTPAAQAPAGATNTPPAVPPVEAGASTAAGERAIVYEERIGQATPTAVNGRIEWSVSREIGPSGKPEPAVQGKLIVPENGLSALITFKLNTDSSLPASHLIEVVFSVPPTFEGGAIEDVQRVAMKRTEQDRGDPLVAVAAKITDDTFLIALNDFQDVVARNLELLRTRNWIDIPVTYRNGRRALLTIDKGATGAAAFENVIKEWAALGTTNGG
ncbi:hypothetical protein [Ciceribacter sp. L1K22]|uniref:hypothetical protein n=1 Tax=Ciceribacter sp. L1K22 TaxID=2820275 RepID=UPI001ABE908D|nr:hypothetical protein [Ciceribacter sp. L1K22]MBO3761968.1 hypothetical protein [Ciceribacter sp. L1K22]